MLIAQCRSLQPRHYAANCAAMISFDYMGFRRWPAAGRRLAPPLFRAARHAAIDVVSPVDTAENIDQTEKSRHAAKLERPHSYFTLGRLLAVPTIF